MYTDIIHTFYPYSIFGHYSQQQIAGILLFTPRACLIKRIFWCQGVSWAADTRTPRTARTPNLGLIKVAMSPLTSVFACPLGDDVPYDDSVRIRLDNQALLRSGWRSSSNSTTSC